MKQARVGQTRARSAGAIAIGALLLAAGLAACGGGGSAAPDTPTPPVTPNPSAITASKPGELLALVKATLAARQAQGWTSASAATLGGDAALAAVPATSTGAALERSNTTVQEAGIDEDDLVKSDGNLIHSLDNTQRNAKGALQSQLNLHLRAADGRVTLLQSLALPADPSTYPSTRGMLLASAAKRLAVLGESVTVTGTPSPCPSGAFCIATDALIYWPVAVQHETQVQAVELAGTGAATATLGTRLTLSGQVVGSRLVGNTLVLVTSYLPTLPVDLLPANATTAEREAALAKTTAADVLPTLRVNGGTAQPLVVDTDCHVQPKNASLSLQVTTITAIDLGAPGLPRRSRCFLGGTEAIYLSPANNLYLATSRYATVLTRGLVVHAAQATTDIHKFSVTGQAITYRASGEVTGHLGWDPERSAYRLSEHNGDLRVLSFTGETGWGWLADANSTVAPSPATLSVLRERPSDQSLQVLGQLPNSKTPGPLGHAGEQVYAVRFAGDRGYLVTFRRTDPLYVLDLSNPADPQQAGELQMPGYSDYLFPLDNGLLLGVGRDADANGRLGGVKVALLDVANPKLPKALDSQTLGGAGSWTALDSSSHGINLFARGSSVRVALPTMLIGSEGQWQQGLSRWEVDTQARKLSAKPALGVTTSFDTDLGQQRSVQIEAQVYWLRNGQLSGWDW